MNNIDFINRSYKNVYDTVQEIKPEIKDVVIKYNSVRQNVENYMYKCKTPLVEDKIEYFIEKAKGRQGLKGLPGVKGDVGEVGYTGGTDGCCEFVVDDDLPGGCFVAIKPDGTVGSIHNDQELVIGILQENTERKQVGRVRIVPGLDKTMNRLIPGKRYYLHPDGLVYTHKVKKCVYVGVAVKKNVFLFQLN